MQIYIDTLRSLDNGTSTMKIRAFEDDRYIADVTLFIDESTDRLNFYTMFTYDMVRAYSFVAASARILTNIKTNDLTTDDMIAYLQTEYEQSHNNVTIVKRKDETK